MSCQRCVQHCIGVKNRNRLRQIISRHKRISEYRECGLYVVRMNDEWGKSGRRQQQRTENCSQHYVYLVVVTRQFEIPSKLNKCNFSIQMRDTVGTQNSLCQCQYQQHIWQAVSVPYPLDITTQACRLTTFVIFGPFSSRSSASDHGKRWGRREYVECWHETDKHYHLFTMFATKLPICGAHWKCYG